jgi:hypothetical protein
VTWLLPAATLAGAVGTTSWFCVRPVRHGASCVTACAPNGTPIANYDDLDNQIRQTRVVLDDLRISMNAAGDVTQVRARLPETRTSMPLSRGSAAESRDASSVCIHGLLRRP